MNDQQNPYDPYYPQPGIVGYDEYGQPVYEQPQQPQQYDPYAQQQQQPQQQPDPGQSQGRLYGYDPYAQPQPVSYQQPQQYDPYAQQQPDPGHTQGYGQGYEPSAQQSQQQQPPQQPPPAPAEAERSRGEAVVPGQRRPEGERDYRTEQFSFIEEPDADSEDVIDWLKFTESRSERREEAKRRGRVRNIALIVVLALLVVGAGGYLWYAQTRPGQSSAGGSSAAGPQKRDVIVLHLHNTKKKGTSTALLVDNVTTRQAATVLLPGALTVANDDGTVTTLAKSVEDDGSDGTREAVGTLLGAKITGTWRLDTPFLENLVELVGGIDLTTDTAVPGAKSGDAPLVGKGENQTLNGRAAVAYATHRAPGEAEPRQLARFGQVMQAVLKKLPSDARSATVTVETLAQILDPSLTESDLGASLAKLAERAKGGDHKTELLPVQQDGTLTAQASGTVVKDILGGSVSAPDKGDAVRVGIRNATGATTATETARVSLVNGGYAVVDGGKADPATASQVTYGDEARKEEAIEVAKTLGLPAGAVKKGDTAPNADVSVVLGQDFKTG
ncbi:polydiglycosylphosphate transferase PdtA [Streptomyces amakusaensis]|uniref:LCP family protein n=1 Tax=Streptomyces amakusaensis TaxID=67271 RepID=A0ABW0ABT3_9ACTN